MEVREWNGLEKEWKRESKIERFFKGAERERKSLRNGERRERERERGKREE